MNIYTDRPDPGSTPCFWGRDFYNLKSGILYERTVWWKFWLPRFKVRFIRPYEMPYTRDAVTAAFWL